MAKISYLFAEFVVPRRASSAQTLHQSSEGGSTVSTEFDHPHDWIEDLGGLSFDELRDLPFAVQAGLDTAVFE